MEKKSSLDWLYFGDQNTKNFHFHTILRRKHNQITSLKNEEGDQIFDKRELKSEAVNFFQNMYGEQLNQMMELPPSSFSNLNRSGVLFLNKEVSKEEIKTALFNMVLLKSLGSDGFHALFFQNQWDKIDGAICAWVQKVFTRKAIENKLNNTLIVLTSKVSNPKVSPSSVQLAYVLFFIS